MTIPGTIRDEYERWRRFLETQITFSLPDSREHTKAHCARVLLFALTIADKLSLPPAERDALGAAAVFHDSRRRDDWLDVGHGQRAADFYRQYCRTHALAYDARVYAIMAYHDRDDALGEQALAQQKTGVLLYRVFKDADALDRFRLGPDGLDVRYLRIGAAKALCAYARQVWEDSQRKERKV